MTICCLTKKLYVCCGKGFRQLIFKLIIWYIARGVGLNTSSRRERWSSFFLGGQHITYAMSYMSYTYYYLTHVYSYTCITICYIIYVIYTFLVNIYVYTVNMYNITYAIAHARRYPYDMCYRIIV